MRTIRLLVTCLLGALLEHLVELHAFQGLSSLSLSTTASTTLGHRWKKPPTRPTPLQVLSSHPINTKEDHQSTEDADSSQSSSSVNEEYRNPATQFLSRFMSSSSSSSFSSKKQSGDPLNEEIDWDAPKIPPVSMDRLAQALDAELYTSEWFVTGRVNPRYFDNQFRFRDPDVQIQGIRNYAQGVRKIFNQNTARAEIISTVVSNDNMITCTWRLSGNVNLGPAPGGLTIKPYLVYTDFTVDATTGLIVLQQDRFAVPGWDILLSAFFPFLIGTLTAEPAPVPEPRDPPPTVPPGVLSSSSSWQEATKNAFSSWLK